MEWPVYAESNPVYLHATRPGRGRPRMSTEHSNRQQLYVQDGNGMLVPAAVGNPVYRSASTSARPSSVIIHNNHWDDHSPVRSSHRGRSSHGRDYYDDDSDYSDRGRRSRSRSRSKRAHSHCHARHRPSSSPSPTPHYQDPELERRLQRLDEIEKQEEEKAQILAAEQRKKIKEIESREEEAEARKRYEEEKIMEAEKERRKEEEEKERKEKWIEQWNHEEEEKRRKEAEKKKAEDEAFRERTLKTFRDAGYSEESVTEMLKRAERKKDGKKEKHPDKGSEMALLRPTYIKVHRKYLSTETLDTFELPWEWDVSHIFFTS